MATGIFLLLARVLLAAMFLTSGFAALSDIAGTAGYFGGLGLPFPGLTAWGVGLFELAAGVLLILGLLTRPVAALLAAFTLVAGFLGHYGQGDSAMLAFLHQQMFLKDIAVAGGLIVLAIQGAGRFALDARMR
ncbi:MAG: DoxX family protein [Rhizobiaceae bacterium]